MTLLTVELVKGERSTRCAECEKTLPKGTRSIVFRFRHKGLHIQVRTCMECGPKQVTGLQHSLAETIKNVKSK